MKAHQSVRIFENPYLEKLTHVHPVMPLVFWAPVVLYLAWRSIAVDSFSAFNAAGIALIGMVFWTLAEYVLHRYVFHFKPKNAWQDKLQFIMHGNHHVDPNDPTRLVMPPAGSYILGMIFYPLFRSVLGHVIVDPFFMGFVMGYLSYDYTHYAIHHFKPRTTFGKWVKQNHMLHHYVAHEARWGVSSPIWDHIFNTLGDSPGVRPQSFRPAAGAEVRPTQDIPAQVPPSSQARPSQAGQEHTV
jgi:dihydroceramide fatty acyl 2-hydroxylase